jgi:hypothetical protein
VINAFSSQPVSFQERNFSFLKNEFRKKFTNRQKSKGVHYGKWNPLVLVFIKSLTFQNLGVCMQTDIEILEPRETPGVIWIPR